VRDLAKIAVIQTLRPIEGKDRIELATVENYPVIVGKNEFQVGDLVVFCEYDTILPVRPEFEFLRKRCWSEGFQGFRIKNMKMSGEYSSGIVFNTSILPESTKVKEGVDVTEILGVQKYDVEELKERATSSTKKRSRFMKMLLRYSFFRKLFLKKRVNKNYPATVQKSDETNIQKLFNKYKANYGDTLFYKTEKLEGQAVSYMLVKGKYRVYSHNVMRDNKGGGTWETLGRELNIEAILKDIRGNWCIQGEICGTGIQGNIYGFTNKKLFVYKVTKVDTGQVLNVDDLIRFCEITKLQMVPFILPSKLPQTLEEILAEADGDSVFKNNGKVVKREGVVWRSTTDQHIGFKAKSRKYAVEFERKNATL